MSNPTDAERIEALERYAAMVADGLSQAVDHIRALTIVTATVLAACSDQDRAEIRAAALAGLSAAPADVRLRPLIATVTLDPIVHAGIGAALANVSGRLQ